RSERTGNYVVGRQVPELALARPSRSPLLIAAEPHLAAVSAQLGDTLFLTVRTGLDTLCVARRIGGYPIQVLSIEVGVRRPLRVRSKRRRRGISSLACRGAGRFRRCRGDAAEAQHDPGAVMVRIALGTGVELGGHRADDALSHAGGARIGLGVEADAVVRNRD